MRYILTILSIFLFTGCDINDLTEDNNSSTTLIPSIDYNSSDNPLYYQQWYLDKNDTFYLQNNIDQNAHINFASISKQYRGKDIKIAIIDDGFDINHPEIKDKIIEKISIDRYGNTSSDVSHTYSSDYHGTAVAGIIAAENNNIGIRGVASEAKLILIKMPDELTDATTIKLFQAAVDAQADIISCSWGTYDVSEAVKDYIIDISSNGRDGKGVLVVFAAGNDNRLMGNDESAIPTVFGVGATTRENLRALYSNYGKDLDIVAPGGYDLGITTIDPLGSAGVSSDEYNRFDQTQNTQEVSFIGTSASAPIISGSLALLLQKDPNLTRKEVFDILKHSTTFIGENTPYLDDMVISNSTTPTITGLLGTSGYNAIKVKFINQSTNTIYGPYSISVNGDNTFYMNTPEELPEGNYTILLVNNKDNVVYATDESFEININKNNLVNKDIKKSDFYGYGKIDLYKLLNYN